ncbi:MAG: NAD-dependent epimerase/dehydratase family protein [Candidatus Pelagibacter sp.]
MNFLITGCAGFIGYSITKKILENKNNNVIGIDRLTNYYSIKLKKKRLSILKKYKNFKFLNKDISKKKNTEYIFKNHNFDQVMHFAAQPGVRRSISHPHEYYDSNISSFFNLLELSKIYKIKKILFASSSSVYGDNKKFPLRESFDRKPKNFYALTKCINEDMANFYSKLYNIKIIGLRFFTVYGPYGRPDMLIWKMCENVLLKKKLKINNFGKHERDFTYIDDVVKMVIEVSKIKNLNNFEIFNVCSNKPSKLKYILKIFKKINNNKSFKNLKFQKFQAGDVIKTHGSNLKLLRKINSFETIKISDGIFKTFDWFKKQY